VRKALLLPFVVRVETEPDSDNVLLDRRERQPRIRVIKLIADVVVVVPFLRKNHRSATLLFALSRLRRWDVHASDVIGTRVAGVQSEASYTVLLRGDSIADLWVADELVVVHFGMCVDSIECGHEVDRSFTARTRHLEDVDYQ